MKTKKEKKMIEDTDPEILEMEEEQEPMTEQEKAEFQEMEAYYESSLKKFKEGELVTGKVIALSKETVTLDVGFKSEGIVNLDEFSGVERDISIGDEIEVFLERVEDENGLVVLSKEKADKIKVWDQLVKASDEDKIIEGVVVAKAKGGLTVDIGLKAFLPGSQIDLRPIRNLEKLIGEKFEMKIIKMNKKRGNIVCSRRILLEEKRKQARRDTLENMQEGNLVEGIVKNITNYGVFVDLGGIDGLLHITDMSWGRVNHPSEMFSIGDKINVMILKFDKESERVSLGLKQITPDPWVDLNDKYPVDTRITGRVVSITDYGAFVELEKGVEGLIHISEMTWSRQTRHPSKIVSLNEMVDAVVLTLDKDKKRISLGMKQIEPNPWEDIETKYPISSQVEGIVRNLTDFGAFIELEDGVDGLIHISDLSWSKIKHPSEVVKKKEFVNVMVLSIDKDAYRISLGIKQLQPNPWEHITEKLPIGTEVTATVVKITGFGVFAEFGDGLEGLIHISQLSTEKVSHPEKVVKVGDIVKAKVVKVDTANKKIGLSVKAFKKKLDVSQIEQEQAQSEMEPQAQIETEGAGTDTEKSEVEPVQAQTETEGAGTDTEKSEVEPVQAQTETEEVGTDTEKIDDSNKEDTESKES